MKNLLIATSIAASVALPSAASAQAIPPAVVAVVDLEKVTTNCNACRTASAALRSQVSGLQSRQQTLAAPLETEQRSIQTAVDALNGKEPDAALKSRVQAWQTRRQQAQDEVTRQEQQIQANSEYVKRQIAEKLGPIYSQVMQRHGANIMVEIGTTLASGANLDVTNDVLTALNAALPTIQTTAPVAPTNRAQPQGR
ncbi:MAG TPA: OmpH family outer membrane protein [Sphingomicrobium sp.]|nr:OmpH family outer membrane protein [Sphingomicrobium sp.]